MFAFVIEEVDEATPEIVEAVTRLLPLLSRSAPPPTAAEVQEITDSPATILLIARDPGRDPEAATARPTSAPGRIVGTLTVALFRIPTGIRAWIEDVIVAEEVRGRGCGEQLTEAALAAARRHGARTVELTSRPSREAANRLYQRLGFERRETNVYRYDLEAAR